MPNSPWFVEVKDPNTPLLAPMLVASKGTKNGQSGSRHGSTSDLTAANNYANKINSELKQVSCSYWKYILVSKKYVLLPKKYLQSSLFQQNKVETNNFSSSFNSSSTSKFESNLSSLKNGVEDLSINKNKKNNSNSDFHKSDFGSYSLLETPKLLSGSKSSSSKTFEEEKRVHSASTEHLNNSNSFTAPKTTYSTTIERSINTGSGYSSLNKPHEARVKGLTNGSSTMPKSSTFNKSVERRSSLHAKVAEGEGAKVTNGSGGHHTQHTVSSLAKQTGYNATSASSSEVVQHTQASFR